MSGSGKSIRDSLAGKELTGFKKSPEQSDHTVVRASSAKVTILKAPKKPASSDQ